MSTKCKENPGTRLTVSRYNDLLERRGIRNPEEWEFVEGLDQELSGAFTGLVQRINDSPMSKRASHIDKGQGGYWSRPHEKAARAFENYIMDKMIRQGFHNDYLANVVMIEDFKKEADNYPYLLPDEIEPISKAFDGVLEAIKKHEPEATAKYEPKITRKEPWEMSKAEWVKEQGKAVSGPSVQKTEALAKNLHRNYVKIWLSEGKPVSPEVLKDYPELIKKEEAPMVKVAHRIIENSPELKVKNLEELPRGTGAPYLEVIESHIPGEYIAAAWRRKVRDNEPGIFIKFNRTPRGDTREPQDFIITREPEKLAKQGFVYRAYYADGTPLYVAKSKKQELVEHLKLNYRVKSITVKDKEPAPVKTEAPQIDKDEEDYYAEFAEDRGERHEEEYKDIPEPEAPAAVKAELKESIKEGKAIDKSAEAVVKEAEKVIEKTPEPEPAIRSHLKTMSYDDRMMYREVVERRLEELQRMTGEMSEEARAIKEYLSTDPIANFRAKVGTRKIIDTAATKAEGKKVFKQTDVKYGLTDLLNKTGEWPETLSKKQANLVLMGRTLKPSSVNAKGRVPWENVLDELADIFKVSEQELIDHVENIKDQKIRLRDMDGMIAEAADREKELQNTMDELRKYDEITGGAPTEYAQPFVRQEPGEPEAGMQKGMFGEDKEVRPQGKGKVTQINLMDYGKLQEIKEKVKKVLLAFS